MSNRRERAGRWFARFATDRVVARPKLWRLFRRPVEKQFDRLAPVWDKRRGPESLMALGAALDRLEPAPERILDLGTGTGAAARVLARRFTDASVIGVDLSAEMIAEAGRLLPPELGDRVRFEQADAASLPFEDGSFDLVVLLNAIPFFDELARVTKPGGAVVFSFSSGPATPIYVPTDTLRNRLEPLGFARFEDVEVGGGTSVLARLTA